MKTPAIKLLAAAAALFLGTTGAHATVTMIFGTGATYASNWANSAGVEGGSMAWGILVDTSGNGFLPAFGGYSGIGVNLTANGSYQSLPDNITHVPTDDLLFLSPALMTTVPNTNDAGVVGQNRITGITSIPLTNGVDAGDHFMVVWFNNTVLGGSSLQGLPFGTLGNAIFTMPADGNTQPYFSAFVGADPLKPMTGRFDTPEPSTLMLSALGALALIRRRR